MKEKLSSVFSMALCVVLVCAAIAVGVRGGWMDERNSITALAGQYKLVDDAADDALNDFVISCYNLSVVAARHLPADDPRIADLRNAYLHVANDELAEVNASNQKAVEASRSLAEELPAMESVKNSAADMYYVTKLTRKTAEAPDGVVNAVTDKIAAFNKKLSGSLMGRLASLLGVRPIE